MSINTKLRTVRYPLYGLVGAVTILLIFVAYHNWMVALLSLPFFIGLIYAVIVLEQRNKRTINDYISTLSSRLKKVGEEALLEMPIGIMLVDDNLKIEWTNPYLAACFQEDTLVGKSVYDVSNALIPIIKQDMDSELITIQNRKFNVVHKGAERLLYFFDVTEQVEIENLYKEERTVISIIYLDNYDELTQGMNDQKRSSLNSVVTSLLDKWAEDNGVFLKRTSSDRFIGIFNENILRKLEMNKFSILDTIRETTAKKHVPLTLSVGIGCGELPLPDLGGLAQSSLDLALGRGGDQVAIKLPNGKARFFGGKTSPVEKRTRVRARVISHALKDIILDSDKVIIMGHKYPDMDAIGSAIGISKLTEMNGRDSYIVVNEQELDVGVQRMMTEIKGKEELYSRFIRPDSVYDMVTEDTLLVIVDTHKPSMIIDENILNRIDRVVIIDHHRRGEEFINHSLLVYMEPYASSTAELVTELLEYQEKKSNLEMLEATALLAGIIVDTKSFTLRTGSRTFDAASYLRTHGADTILVQKFLKEDLDTFLKRAKLIKSVMVYKDGIVIAKADQAEINEQVLIAQTADTLLSMEGVDASFVVSKREEDLVSISARSLGEVNVQVIMEQLNGGGHLTNAATQLEGVTIDEAVERLKKVLDENVEGGNTE